LTIVLAVCFWKDAYAQVNAKEVLLPGGTNN
jgi:hypothetical protein